MHFNVVSVVTGDDTGSVANKCDDDDATEAVDNDEEGEEDAGAAVKKLGKKLLVTFTGQNNISKITG